MVVTPAEYAAVERARAIVQLAEAVGNLRKVLVDVSGGHVSMSPMKYGYADYRSYHFRSHIEQGQPADMRVPFKPVDGGIEVLAFGNRHAPSDFHSRFLYRLP